MKMQLFIFFVSFSLQAMEENEWHLTINLKDDEKYQMSRGQFEDFCWLCVFFEKESRQEGFFDRNQVLNLAATQKEWDHFYELACMQMDAQDLRKRLQRGQNIDLWRIEQEEEKFKFKLSLRSIDELASLVRITHIFGSKIGWDVYKQLETTLCNQVSYNPKKYLEPGFANRQINMLNVNNFDRGMLKEAVQKKITEYKSSLNQK